MRKINVYFLEKTVSKLFLLLDTIGHMGQNKRNLKCVDHNNIGIHSGL